MLTPADWAVLERHTEAENAHRLADTLATLTEDCVFEDIALGTTHRGRDEVATYYEMWWSALDLFVVVEQAHEVADQPMVIAETVWRGRHIGTFLAFRRPDAPSKSP